ncbi:MAG: IMP cyclohydrolase [Lentisphaerae bacterium]|nr:MAG: IMP cyclohydrolase [Lentisphaerota bacterium]
MYVGRIVAGGWNREGNPVLMYRVSSRSFPNRRALLKADQAAIIPKEGFENDIHKNPYIAYNCLKVVSDEVAVISNGTHTDHIAIKLAAGWSPRDALAGVLMGMDYEHDTLNTPRIAAVMDRREEKLYLGTVRDDALLVRAFAMQAGTAYYVATYEHNAPEERYRDGEFTVETPETACDYVLGQGVFGELERPISAVAALWQAERGWQIAAKDAPASRDK